MYRTAALLYFVCFALYIMFSRQPYYFESELTPGVIVDARTLDQPTLRKYHISAPDAPVVKYRVGTETYYYNGGKNYLQRHKAMQKVQVIYDPDYPEKARLYTFFGYWINLDELIFSVAGFVILFGASIAITGKKQATVAVDKELERQMKYN